MASVSATVLAPSHRAFVWHLPSAYANFQSFRLKTRLLRCRASDEAPAQTTEATPLTSTSVPSASPKTAVKSPKQGKGFGKPQPAASPKVPSKATAAAPANNLSGKSSSPSGSVVRRPAPQQPLLSAQAQQEKAAEAAKIETFVVSSLATAFVLILMEGIFLASAGAFVCLVVCLVIAQHVAILA